MKAHYTTFAAYNAWANRRLYDAVAALSDSEYRADRGAFFKSMHGTLNHLLTTDRIWMQRFTGEGDAPSRLDTILHETLAALRAAREAEDRRIVSWIDSLDEARLAGTIRYRRVSTPEEFVQPLMPALDHWFNHQTHHRGQAHMILTSLGKQAPELDLLYFQRLQSAA
ncbi:MAG: DinB family protein [Reyranellales bacterium]